MPDIRMGFQSGNVQEYGVKQRVSVDQGNETTNTDHQAIPPVPPNHSYYFPPTTRRAAFQSRSNSRSSIGSSHQDSQLSFSGNFIFSLVYVLENVKDCILYFLYYCGKSGVSASSWMENDSFYVLQHLQKHATTFGLDAASVGTTSSKNAESGNNKVSFKSRFTMRYMKRYLNINKIFLDGYRKCLIKVTTHNKVQLFYHGGSCI